MGRLSWTTTGMWSWKVHGHNLREGVDRRQGPMKNLSFKIRNMDPNNLSKKITMIRDYILQQKKLIKN
jgi:hypothetical protein